MMFGAAQPIQQPEGDRAPAVEMPAVPNTGSRGGRRPVQDESSTDPDLTMLPPSGAAAPAPSWMSAAPEEPASPATNTAPVQRRAPPGRQRPLPTPAPLPIPSPEQMEAVSPVGAQTMELQLSLKKRQRLLPIIVGVLVGAALVAGGIYFYLKTRTPPADPALVAEDGRALDLLRQDDEDSIKKAVDIWQSLQVRSPDFVPPRANELIAHVFLNQNLHDDAGRLTRQAEQAQRDMVRVTEKKVGANWVDKANALRDEIIKIKEQVEPLQEAATKHDERANELLKSCAVLMGRLGPAADSSAVFRASALYYSVKGHDGTEKLAATYQKGADERGVLHDDARAFADLAMAGRYAQPRITPGDRDKGVAAAQAALQKDPKLLRAHYYLAKIYLANKEYDLASTEAEALLAANPAHKAAAALKAEIAQAQAAAPKPEKPSEPK
jgi:tetratricopeptide (TPR) repeat protein